MLNNLQIIRIYESYLNFPVDLNKHNLRCANDLFTIIDDKGSMALQPPSEINRHGITGIVAIYNTGYLIIAESQLNKSNKFDSDSASMDAESLSNLFCWLEPKLSDEVHQVDPPGIETLNIIGKLGRRGDRIYYLEELYDYLSTDFSHWDVTYDPEISPFLFIQKFKRDTGCRINFIPFNELPPGYNLSGADNDVGFGDLSKLSCDLYSKAISIIQRGDARRVPLFDRWPDNDLRMRWLLHDLKDQERVRFLKYSDDFGEYNYLKCIVIVSDTHVMIHNTSYASCIEESLNSLQEILEFFSGSVEDRYSRGYLGHAGLSVWRFPMESFICNRITHNRSNSVIKTSFSAHKTGERSIFTPKNYIPKLNLLTRMPFTLYRFNSLKGFLRSIFIRTQMVSLLASYLVYNFYFSSVYFTLPFQLIPNDLGMFNTIGLDTLSGVFGLLYLIKFNNWSDFINKLTRKTSKFDMTMKRRFLPVSVLLAASYIISGHVSLVVDRVLYHLGEGGIVISDAMSRSLQVFIGHILWISMGSVILERMLSPFFGSDRWYSNDFNDYWMPKSLLGYSISSLIFNLIDSISTGLTFDANSVQINDNIVTTLTDPNGNDVLAMLIGSLGPCVTAAWWEEILYRGFVTRALNSFLYPLTSIPISAFLFSLHHLNLSNAPHLFILGLIWELINLNYDNLIVPISIHSMWNTRVFLASILGV